MSSNFLVLVTIMQAEFCTDCNLLIFFAEDLTDQRSNIAVCSLPFTNTDPKRDKVPLLKNLRALLICDNFDMQEETTSVICWSYVQ